MNEADVDKNGVIDEAEFGKFAAEVFIKKVAKEEQIQDVFDVINTMLLLLLYFSHSL